MPPALTLAALLLAAPDPCATTRWTLEGASERPGDGQAAFVAAWTPTLEIVAHCLGTPALRDACLIVRGHADEVPFGEVLATALGSQDAAQTARARGRAMMVIAALGDLGTSAERIREGPPVLRSGFRGVELSVVPACLDAAAREGADPARLAALVDRRIAVALKEHDERNPPPPPLGPDATRTPPRLFVDAALDVTVLGFEPSTVLAPALQLGVGWRPGRAILRLGAGLSAGTAAEQRVGFEAVLSGAWTVGGRFEVGPLVRYRLASVKASEPWLEQAFALGAQGSHCGWALPRLGGELCLTGAVLPLGFREVTGRAVDGRAVRTAWSTRYGAEGTVGLVVRKVLR